jgi:hypothetical protein
LISKRKYDISICILGDLRNVYFTNCLRLFNCSKQYKSISRFISSIISNNENQLNDDPGGPLFLTPYIEQGNIEEARQLSLISSFFIFIPFLVYMNYRLLNNNSSGFFSAQNPNKLDTPIMLWLQVGPDSSLLFSEI